MEVSSEVKRLMWVLLVWNESPLAILAIKKKSVTYGTSKKARIIWESGPSKARSAFENFQILNWNLQSSSLKSYVQFFFYFCYERSLILDVRNFKIIDTISYLVFEDIYLDSIKFKFMLENFILEINIFHSSNLKF